MFDRFRKRTRRSLLVAAAGGLTASVVTFFAGRATVSASTSPVSAIANQLDDVALGPIDGLERRALDVLAEIEVDRATPALWIGVERLVLQALVGPRKALQSRLVLLRAHADLPAHVAEALAKLVVALQGR